MFSDTKRIDIVFLGKIHTQKEIYDNWTNLNITVYEISGCHRDDCEE
jgi:hypothetical protein